MRISSFGVACAALWTAAAVACATSKEAEPPAEEDGEPTVVPDASLPEDAGSPAPDAADASDASDTSAPAQRCSTAGWCKIDLPDDTLSVVDVWPLDKRAFVIATTPYLGTKVLEWDGATKAWTYIDDGTENEPEETGFFRDASSIWSPNDDEVYFTVASKTSGFVYHGERPVPPATTWKWTRSAFQTCADVKLWVYGTGPDDVYAASCTTIYRKGADGHAADAGPGAPSGWTVDHVEVDATSNAVFATARGTGRDDVWFGGGRKRPGQTNVCSFVFHRTAAGYESIVDTNIQSNGSCTAKSGALAFSGGLFSSLHQTGPGRIVVMSSNALPTLFMQKNDGTYGFAFAPVRPPNGTWSSAWVPSEDEVWLSRAHTGQLLRGRSVWGDGGAYEYSSIALDGTPIVTPMQQIRGTSNTNLWAVGGNYVFHKTTP